MRWHPTDPIDFEASTARFTRWGMDLSNLVENRTFYRVSDQGVAYAARQLDDGTIELQTADPADEPQAVSDLKWRLGEAIDRTPLAELAQSDPKVAGLVARYRGLRPPLQVDPFQSLITSITAQQVNLAWATTTRSRLILSLIHI